MRLEYTFDHFSIKRFDSIEFPDLTVLTGVNGSGKTHLMQAIQSGSVRVDDISTNDILCFTPMNFIVDSDQSLNGQHIEQQSREVWQYLQGTQGGHPRNNWMNVFNNLYHQAFVIHENEKTIDLFDDFFPKDLNLWEYEHKGNEIHERLKPRLDTYFSSIKQSIFDHPDFKNIPLQVDIIKTFKEFGKPFHRMLEADFYKLFIPSSKRLIGTRLGVIFTRYKISQYLWAHREWEKGGDISKEDLYSQYEKTHRKPWDVVNEILNEVHSYTEHESVFNFSITNPEKNPLDLDTWQSYSFTPTLIDQNDGEERHFGFLSSGEQVLLALAFSIYESRNDFTLPKILMLDEVDATLHPSMTKALLNTLQKVFVNKGTKVILATHSPSTVALSMEESLFAMNKSGYKRIQKITKDKALSILTTGVPTLSINYENRRQVFVESKHDVAFYEKVYERLRDNENLRGNLIPEISLNFISSGVGGQGSCQQVKEVVNTLTGYGNRSVYGIIDWDTTNTGNKFVKVLGKDNRYSIENYIFDPILLTAFLL